MILIIDDKDLKDSTSLLQLEKELVESSNVKICNTISDYISVEKGKVRWNERISKFRYVLIHERLETTTLGFKFLREKSLLGDQLNNMGSDLILFSGGGFYHNVPVKNGSCFEINRITAIKNLVSFVNSKERLGEYELKSLYDENYFEKLEIKRLFTVLKKQTIDDGVNAAMFSDDFEQLLRSAGFDQNRIALARQRSKEKQKYEFVESILAVYKKAINQFNK